MYYPYNLDYLLYICSNLDISKISNPPPWKVLDSAIFRSFFFGVFGLFFIASLGNFYKNAKVLFVFERLRLMTLSL